MDTEPQVEPTPQQPVEEKKPTNTLIPDEARPTQPTEKLLT